jgi:hypothetical protein
MAAASSTEVPPNFMTTHSSRELGSSLPGCEKSFMFSPPVVSESCERRRIADKEKPTGQCFWRWVLLAAKS